MAMKSMLTLGKKGFKSLDEIIKGAGSKFAGKGKKVIDLKSKAKKKQVSKRAENLAKKKARSIKKPISKKEYEKTLPDTLKKKTTGKEIVPVKKNKPTGTAIIKKPSSNITKKPGTSLVVSDKSRSLVNIPKGSAGKQTSKNILNKQKQSFLKRNKGKIAGVAGVLSTVPYLIDTKDSKVSAKENKKVTPPKDFSPKIKKTPTPSVKREDLPKTKSDDYTGRFIDKEGNVAYDSFSDFLAHMTGKPKKRAMPKKTARIIGTGNKLKRKEADTKGAGKGVKFKAFSGGGLIEGLYDKPEKAETYKGNTSSARQVKGYGKARKRP